jgi:hypothetical protein
MINHRYKCIYIHLQATAGTYIERLICKDDWINIDSKSKHLTARQTQSLYKEYWNDYFKFSFIRNPWARHLSLSKFLLSNGIKKFEPVTELYKKINSSNNFYEQAISFYKEKYNYPLTQEYHLTQPDPEEAKTSNSVYENILNLPIDFIGQFENLDEDLSFVFNKLKINEKVSFNKKNCYKYKDYYNKTTKEMIEDLYKYDIKKYNYLF